MTTPAAIRLDDGTEIVLEGPPAQGTRHQVLQGRERRTGTRVVVKVELIEGALETERRALSRLAGGPVPRVIRVARVSPAGGRQLPCLVLEHRPGGAPETVAGWRRLGRALAPLPTFETAATAAVTGLDVLDARAVGAAHAARVQELGAELSAATAAIEDWARCASAELPGGGAPLVLTHGDPGPGNFLDDGRAGTLIDFEEAHVAPRGLDLARARFIALLGAGPSGYVARDRDERAHAVAAGYSAALGDAWTPGEPELRWWLAVAGVQFAHRRRERALPEAPAGEAIAVLAEALSEHSDGRFGHPGRR